MPSDYPPLATPKEGTEKENIADKNSMGSKALQIRQRLRAKDAKDAIIVPESTSSAPIVISSNGDIILEYTVLSSGKKHYWQVLNERLMIESPYFSAMLDSDKFMEGRLLAQQRQALVDRAASRPLGGSKDGGEGLLPGELPIVKIPGSTKLDLCGVEAMQLFLRILCLDFSDTEAQRIFYDVLAALSPSIIVKVIDIAEWFNSTSPVQKALKIAQYRGGGKPKTGASTKVFTLDMLKLKERRIREMILVSSFMGLHDILKAKTHSLIIIGSKYWQHGVERPMTEEYLSWRYLPSGLEGMFGRLH